MANRCDEMKKETFHGQTVAGRPENAVTAGPGAQFFVPPKLQFRMAIDNAEEPPIPPGPRRSPPAERRENPIFSARWGRIPAAFSLGYTLIRPPSLPPLSSIQAD